MAELVHPLLDSTRLLFDLQQVGKIAQAISGCLEPVAIATQVTNALVDQFDCVFARIWLVEPDQQTLRLVSSSGLYTHTDGSFAQVPMGAYKVGKIAQNRVPFLSNNLPEEPWVKDRAWAISNCIQGFAGYPLAVGNRVIGVLAAFSRHPFAPEFLEVLQVLCMTTTIALDAALQAQGALKSREPVRATLGLGIPLSDQLAAVLTTARLMLVGTERPLSAAMTYLFLQAVEGLNQVGCNYCRLSYGDQSVALEALIAAPVGGLNDTLADAGTAAQAGAPWLFPDIQWMAQCLGGTFELQTGTQRRALQYLLQVPYTATLGPWVAASPLPSASLENDPEGPQRLSEREQEIIKLLAQGMRDRDIAQALHISESTVKFHINNSAAKLNAKNRYQAVYQAAIRGWI